jgi:hypothetical protein
MTNAVLRSSLLALAALLLTACGNDGTSDPVPPAVQAELEILVVPSLGKVTGAGAQALDVNGDPLSEEAETGTDGTVTLRIPASHNGPLLVRLRGRVGATYFDEATRQDEDLGEDVEFRAAMSAPTGTVGVSILTELAVRLAEASGTTLDAAAIDAANEQIRAALAPEVADLLTPPTVVDGDTMAGAVDDSDGGRLAARLAALANLASTDATPALTILQQLAADVADGVIDGVDANGDPIMTAYAPASFAADFVRAVQDFAAAFGDAALQSSAETAQANVDVDAGVDGGSGGSGGSNFVTEPATVNSGLVGAYTLVYFDSDSAGRDPFANDEQVMANIGSDGTLTVGNIGPLSNPFLQSGPAGGAVNTAEIIWEDPATGLLYAVTNNDSGTFNEINVGDPQNPQQSGFPGFVGQLREAQPASGAAGACGTGSGTSLIANCAGTYSVTSSSQGFHTNGQVVIGTDGSVDFDDGISFTAADINEIFDRLSVDRRIQINYGADDDADVIQLFLNEALDAVETIVYRNRTEGTEITLTVVLQTS